MLNRVPKFAQCDERTKKNSSPDSFQSRKPKQKNLKFKNFPQNISREPSKGDVCQVSMLSKKQK